MPRKRDRNVPASPRPRVSASGLGEVPASPRPRVPASGRGEVAPEAGPKRVVIEAVTPEIDGGRFFAKRVVGERLVVEADIFTDGHDAVRAVLKYRHQSEENWTEVEMAPLGNDRWRASLVVDQLGRYHYTLEAWVDRFLTWVRDLEKRIEAGQELGVQLIVGAELVEAAAARAEGDNRKRLEKYARALRIESNEEQAIAAISAPDFEQSVSRYPDRQFATTYRKVLTVTVDPVRARFSSWYEMFPRSASSKAGKHGTLDDVIKRLPYIAEMGFNVLYLPPIHPIGKSFRKGRNNTLVAQRGDVGSPWAIGSDKGGHRAIHPDLGTLEDFRRLVKKARGHQIEIALDIALQTSPDHPWMEKHPEFFRWRPDGTVQYAENPPKKYQDIYPFHFETENWHELWNELRDVFLYWIDQGVRVFRVDNPHTKPFPFWEWAIGEIKSRHPEVIFLAEAFTRPKVMYYLAKLGFSQSYTYFAWRNEKWDLMQYFNELARTGVREFFRPNAWPNTPDILTEYLQHGGRSAFMIRLILAATLCANYGIYGPPFELLEHQPRDPGSEEYLDSEKYEIRAWDWKRSDSLRELIGRVNRIREGNPALQSDWNLQFHSIDNGQMVCYSKGTEDGSNIMIMVVSLDPYHAQSGWLELNLDALRLPAHQSFQVHDLLTNARYSWHGPRNFVAVNPHVVPAHIFRVRRRLRTERNFEYYL